MSNEPAPVGRPRKYGKRIATAVRLRADLHERLTRTAAERGLSANVIVQRAIEEYLDRLVPVEDLLRTREPESQIDEAYR